MIKTYNGNNDPEKTLKTFLGIYSSSKILYQRRWSTGWKNCINDRRRVQRIFWWFW